jgi:hypothetical protein
MADKRLYLNNTDLRYSPNQLSGFITRANSRALVIGRSWNLAAYPSLNDYFDAILVEGWAGLSLLTPTKPDVVLGLNSSLYDNGVYEFDLGADASNILFCLRWEAAQELSKLGKQTNNRQLVYLSGGTVGLSASEVRSVSAGLAEGNEGVHLAKIMGCVSIYDTESREGTIAINDDVLLALLNDKDKYGISRSFIGQNRPVLLEKI